MTPPRDPFRSVSCELLSVLADEGRPLSVSELNGRLDAAAVGTQLSVARIAGFVRRVPGPDAQCPAYAPTALGYAIARRSHALGVAQRERRLAELARPIA